jgi:hypothetical protein
MQYKNRIKADCLQQLNDNDELVYLPILYIDGKLTTIAGADKQLPSHKMAVYVADKWIPSAIEALKKYDKTIS